VSTFAIELETTPTSTPDAIAREVRVGLSATPKTLAPWLFYDEAGSDLFEQITQLPEYYLTRIERGIFTTHAEEILREAASANGPHPAGKLTLIELGAGTAT
jgi:L-histidine N-alpha-methyltransferase